MQFRLALHIEWEICQTWGAGEEMRDNGSARERGICMFADLQMDVDMNEEDVRVVDMD